MKRRGQLKKLVYPIAQQPKYFQIDLNSFEPLYNVYFVLFSLAGLVTKGYFYCGCMIYVLYNPTAIFIAQILKRSGEQY